jgi:hypothetical protein
MSTPEQPDDAPAAPPSTPGKAVPVAPRAADEPDTQPGDEPAEQPGDEPAEQPSDATAEQAANEPAEGHAEADTPDPLEAEQISVDPRRVRHAPRYGRFATVGGLTGLALAFLLTPFASFDEPGMVMGPWGFGLLMAGILIPVGILVACMIALVADRRSRRHYPR